MTDRSNETEPGVLRVFQTKDETRRFYDKIAHVYDLLSEKSEQSMRETGLTLLAAVPGEHVLEIGFGTGHCLVRIARAVGPTGRVFGIDLSEKMVELAQDLVRREGVSDAVRLQSADAGGRLPFGDGKLDAIFMSFTLELFDTPEIPCVLGECRRVLRPGGRIVVVGVSKDGPQEWVVRAFEWTHRHFPNLMDCRPIYVARALENAGFQIDKVEQQQMWVPVEIVRGIRSGPASDK
ncbi:MAG TPA: class I SAM-dependent methyltransferase [Planctomycetaceae bacterium]|jgi:demethylmenaquinone methyltransferase/2-methoxy-6-polyprenyl-1,4-benzoquinol methylase|nr:class I SAM-dependent methyltransferase [Planctomycetaceae bacterium]